MITLDPIILDGTPGSIDYSVYQPVSQIRIANHCAQALRLSLGGRNYWLDPVTVDVYPVPTSGSRVSYSPQQLTGAGSGVGTLLVTLAGPGELIPGIYPMHLR